MATTPKKSLGYYLSVGLLRGLNLLPYGWVARFGAGLGHLLYLIPSSRKRVVHTNLRLCFPHWDEATRERVAKASFVHAIRSYAERSVQWFADGKKLEAIAKITEAGMQQHNVTGTPTFILNGKQLEGSVTWPQIEAALKNAGA